MNTPGTDTTFAGSIPHLYERHLVPLIFAPYASDLAARVASRSPSRVLEIAAGTGVVTRALASILPPSAVIVATDLNQAMLDQAKAIGTSRPVEWRQADAMRLPFPDASFDVVVCQFGAMFFPDKPAAFAQARRVLRNRGAYLFNVWDAIEENEFADSVTQALATCFPDDPPRFLARVPHGYHDASRIAHDVALGGFERPPLIDIVTERSRADSPQAPAVAYCQGTPLRSEIEARDPSRLTEATDAAASAIEQRFGSGVVDGKIQALVVVAER
ncbi:MAG TPA: methyltransferase domain-containing protein [Casimicrobiaceae bacterium]|nr:methyltransferase domain-containing protein [Casimicrobiaceae bacterium]